jgi:hypothetical protein
MIAAAEGTVKVELKFHFVRVLKEEGCEDAKMQFRKRNGKKKKPKR